MNSMHRLVLRSLFALLAVALAACSGGGMIPTQGRALGALPPSLIEHANPCKNSKLTWYFRGSCTRFVLTTKGVVVSLPTYKGIGVQLTLGTSDRNNAPFVLGDATGTRDITGKTSFPIYGASTCFTGFTCPGKALVYVEIGNLSTLATTVSGKTLLTTSAAKFPGKHCFPAVYADPTGWVDILGLAKAVKGGKVTISITHASSATFDPGATYVAVVCR